VQHWISADYGYSDIWGSMQPKINQA